MKSIKPKSNKIWSAIKENLQRVSPSFSVNACSRVLCKINRYPFDKEMQDQGTPTVFIAFVTEKVVISVL